MSNPVGTCWDRLEALKNEVSGLTIKALFDADDKRFGTFSSELDGLVFDYSKNILTKPCLDALVSLAGAAGVEGRRDAMFRGDRINGTEGRAVLHTALRSEEATGVSADVQANRDAVLDFAEKIRVGEVRGSTGKAFTDVVNIGIGGSDLGPAMVVEALAPYHTGPRCHFVSNIDGAHIADTLLTLNPETTLFIIASKTFTTLETMTNAHSAEAWLTAALGDKAKSSHFAAVSAAPDKAAAFGIRPDAVFSFQEWVGGRYSVWSSVGLPVAVAIGGDGFCEFLAGAQAVDTHFRSAPLGDNIPVLMAMIGIWNRNVLGHMAQAVLPYDQRLNRFPAYLQQLDMESNGKRVTLDGAATETATGPLIWGEPGTNGQHAFYQWLHQGTDIVPADFLVAANPVRADARHHEGLLANCLAQTEALAVGRDLEATKASLRDKGYDQAEVVRLAPHQVFPGNRPTNTFVYRVLTPRVMGMLIALYEHKVFVQGVVWGINSFDQWGVELGKELARGLQPAVRGEAECDSISKGLVDLVKDWRD